MKGSVIVFSSIVEDSTCVSVRRERSVRQEMAHDSASSYAKLLASYQEAKAYVMQALEIDEVEGGGYLDVYCSILIVISNYIIDIVKIVGYIT